MRAAVALGLAVSLCFSLTAMSAERLPSLRGEDQNIAVTGLSSGAYMAVQYEIAYSASVKGAGIVAGGPYYCAAGSIAFAAVCMGQVAFTPPVAAFMAAAARSNARSGEIDALDGVKSHRIYVFSGTNDLIVKRPAVDALVRFYKLLGVNDAALQYVTNVPAGHGMITMDYGNDCSSNEAPSINHCMVNGAGYDQAGVILGHVFGMLNPPGTGESGKIVAFDQKEFGSSTAEMADDGYVYIPQACDAGSACKLVIAFHGCAQSAKEVGDKFYAHAGFNRWAETNNIIVLYPQVDASLLNMQGCWDWFGYTGSDYATKTGKQMAAVKAMADRLTSAK